MVTSAQIDVMTDNKDDAQLKLINAIELIDSLAPTVDSCQKVFSASRNKHGTSSPVMDESDDGSPDFKLGRIDRKDLGTQKGCMHLEKCIPWHVKKSVMKDADSDPEDRELFNQAMKDYLKEKPVESNIFEADVIRLEGILRLIVFKNPTPESKFKALKGMKDNDLKPKSAFSFTDCVRPSLNMFKEIKSRQKDSSKGWRETIQSFLTAHLRILYATYLMEALMSMEEFKNPLKLSRSCFKSYSDMLDAAKGYETRTLFAYLCFLHIKCVFGTLRCPTSLLTYNSVEAEQLVNKFHEGGDENRPYSPVREKKSSRSTRARGPPKAPIKNPYKIPDFKEYFTKCFDAEDEGDEELHKFRNETPMSPVIVYKNLLSDDRKPRLSKDFFSPDVKQSPKSVAQVLREQSFSPAKKISRSSKTSSISKSIHSSLSQVTDMMQNVQLNRVSVAIFDSLAELDMIEDNDPVESIIYCLNQLIKYLGNHPPASLYADIQLLLVDVYASIDGKELIKSSYHLTESTSTALRYRAMKVIQKKQKYDVRNRHNMKVIKFDQETNEDIITRVLKECPEGWRVLQINLLEDKIDSKTGKLQVPDLMITRHEKNRNPIVLKIEGDSRKFLENFMDEFKEIIHLSNASIIDREPHSFWKIRTELDTRLKILLRAVEEAWFGPFIGLFVGKVKSEKYADTCESVVYKIMSLAQANCSSEPLLHLLVESAPIICPSLFRTGLVSLFAGVDQRFLEKSWRICRENLIGLETKYDFYRQYKTHPVALILGKGLEQFPFETMPTPNQMNQELFRMPSIRFLLSTLQSFSGHRIHTKGADDRNTFYVVNPTNNLPQTQNLFQPRLESKTQWKGVCGKAPAVNDLVEGLQEDDIYLYFGHGTGSKYYRNISNNLEGVNINAASLVIGCSSGKLKQDGESLEPYGPSYRFLINGAPCYVGALWDVTDRDIDIYTDRLMELWIPCWESKEAGQKKDHKCISLAQAVSEARSACRLKYLIGAATVSYGLPIYTISPNS